MGKTTTKTKVSKSKVGEAALSDAENRLRRAAGALDPRASRVGLVSFRSWVRKGPLSLLDWSHALHMDQRTLSNRLSTGRALGPLEADRVALVHQVMERGTEVFGDAALFEKWLGRAHPVLGGHPPKDLLNSTAGIAEVMMELGRIEHGIF